jgi:hypothetical protein
MSAQSDKAGRAKRRGVGDFVKGGPPIVGLTAYTARSPGFSTRMSIFYWSGIRSEWWSTGSKAPCRSPWR